MGTEKENICYNDCLACASKVNSNAYKCVLAGIWIYKKLPGGMRAATPDDFMMGARFNYGMRYLAKSFVDETYQAYTFTRNTFWEELLVFVEAGRVFIKQKNLT